MMATYLGGFVVMFFVMLFLFRQEPYPNELGNDIALSVFCAALWPIALVMIIFGLFA